MELIENLFEIIKAANSIENKIDTVFNTSCEIEEINTIFSNATDMICILLNLNTNDYDLMDDVFETIYDVTSEKMTVEDFVKKFTKN